MNKEMVMELINNHNDSINKFIYGELATKLGAKNGKIKMNDWFKAQSLIKEQCFLRKRNGCFECMPSKWI